MQQNVHEVNMSVSKKIVNKKTAVQAAPKRRGRKRSANSARMSEACFMRFYGIGRKKETLQQIADSYNSEPRRVRANAERKRKGLKPQTFSTRAIHARVQTYRFVLNPVKAAELLGQANTNPAIAEIAPLVAVTSESGGALVPA